MLRDAHARSALLTALAQCDRLVLLGDVLELRHGPVREALRAAARPLREIGEALGAAGEVVIVAGNHDHHLIEGWAERRAADAPPAALALETPVQAAAGDPLHEVAELLSPARVRVAYPGVWLRDDVYATHGHYLDLHLTVPTLERLAAGVMRRIVAFGPAGPRTAEDYEAALVPIYAWIHALAQRAEPQRSGVLHGGSVRGWRALTGPRGGRGLQAQAVKLTWPLIIAGCNAAGLGPLRPELSRTELRRAGLRALAEVVSRLGVDAEWVIFGHTHRAGPLPADDAAQWRAGRIRLVNAGCWVREPAFTGPDPAASPYRAGFGVFVDAVDPPQLRNLLDR